jgi:hypothetical protein
LYSPKRPDSSGDSHSPLCIGYLVYFSGLNRPGHKAKYLPPSGAVQLHLPSPYVISYCGQGDSVVHCTDDSVVERNATLLVSMCCMCCMCCMRKILSLIQHEDRISLRNFVALEQGSDSSVPELHHNHYNF